MQGLRFDEFGNIVQSRVVIVWGCPASGKTTYVRKNMQPGDLVVDLDLLKQAIGMADKTDASDTLLPIALEMRELLYSIIEDRRFASANVWIVAGLPRKKDREELKRRMNAELVYIQATKEQCIERAMKDNERKDKEKQLRIIDKWFANFFYER